jgi:hypothetical protein
VPDVPNETRLFKPPSLSLRFSANPGLTLTPAGPCVKLKLDRFNRVNLMLFKSHSVALIFLLFASWGAQAQIDLSNAENTCVQEQQRAHKSLKDKSVNDYNFQPYCACVSSYVQSNATAQQRTELESAKSKPSWFKTLEKNAMKSCLAPEPKITS